MKRSMHFGNIRINARFKDFSDLVDRHLRRVPGTKELEKKGKLLRDANFPQEQLNQFIREVCSWGGYAGIAGRILNQNDLFFIQKVFTKTSNLLALVNPKVRMALFEINQIKGLGTPSFASKHLRFLCPNACPVFDSFIWENFGYVFGPSGYEEFSNDCLRIAKALEGHKIHNPMNRAKRRWFASDVEMALFAHLRWARARNCPTSQSSGCGKPPR
jgi:hypothetical protein